jgi:hypothetical protein
MLPDSVSEIGEEAFSYCSKLSELQFPKKLKTIAKGAFSNCGLSQLVLPDGLKTIGAEAFSGGVSLRSIRLPASLASIGAKAFSGSPYRVSSLETVLTFDGTVAQWGAVLKAPAWCENSGIRTVRCTDGDVTL